MSKPPVRLIITAWGEEYVGKVLSFTFPAVLAPGNLPVLAQIFSCTVVFVTEERLFDLVRASNVWQRLEKFAAVKLLPLDDLVAYKDHYGISLTLALLRGFEELGPKMTDTYLLFLNADFILADNSYRSLAAYMLNGERLIHAPSYCVNKHVVMPMLRARANIREGVLAITSREMARLILDHRHNTIRAKTVNQRLFRMHRYDQFYWQVDDNTLLGRQLPIALVCMKPERVVNELHTFWDYGVVSEFCPTAKPCVLGDSDQFLMLELRDAGTFRELFKLGWASFQEIADDLSSFATKDQRDHGRYTLILHDRDLPATLNAAQEELESFVGDVFRRLSPKSVPYLGHPFWTDHYNKLQQRREEYFQARALRRHLGEPLVEEGGLRDETPGQYVAVSLLKKTDGIAASLRRGIVKLLEHVHVSLFGKIPYVKQTHPYYPVLQPAMDAIASELAKPNRKVLLIAPQPGPLSKFVQLFSERGQFISNGNALIRNDGLECQLPESYDLCVCEVGVIDLLALGGELSSLRSWMASHGRIIIFCMSTQYMDLHSRQADIIAYATMTAGQSQIIFGGSAWTQWALALYSFGEKLRTRYGLPGIIGYAGTTLLAVPFSLIGNWVSRRHPNHVMGKHCLSLTMDYRLF